MEINEGIDNIDNIDMFNKFKGQTLLLLATLIWGTAIVAQKVGMDYMDPCTFTFMNFFLGSISMLPIILVSHGIKKKKNIPVNSFKDAGLVKKGMIAGAVYCGVSVFQQFDLVYTTAGKAGFITQMSIILVPVIMVFFFREKVEKNEWLGAATSFTGMYMLSITGGFHLALGDGLVMICAVFNALILIINDRYVDSVDIFKFAFYQFVTATIISLILIAIFEIDMFDLNSITAGALLLLYTGILEIAVAFTLQIMGQKYVNATVASVLLSFEAVFALLTGAILLGESMTLRETIGCIMMFAAIIVTQLKPSDNK